MTEHTVCYIDPPDLLTNFSKWDRECHKGEAITPKTPSNLKGEHYVVR